jgi:hypothetical protein
MSSPINLFMLEVPKAEHVHRMLSAASRPLIGRHPVLNAYFKILGNRIHEWFFILRTSAMTGPRKREPTGH